MTDDDPQPCVTPGCTRPHTNWSAAFSAWLCPQCRWHRTEKELQPTQLGFAINRLTERTNP